MHKGNQEYNSVTNYSSTEGTSAWLSFTGFSLLGGCAQLCGWCVHLHSCLGDEVVEASCLDFRDLSLPEVSQGREYAGRIRILLKSWGTASSCHNVVPPLEL